jgi:cold shock protein
MAEGKIKKLMEKGFGFIDTGTNKDLFFHNSALEGVRFEELREGQRVSYTAGQGPKGPCAEHVKLICRRLRRLLAFQRRVVCVSARLCGPRLKLGC